MQKEQKWRAPFGYREKYKLDVNINFDSLFLAVKIK